MKRLKIVFKFFWSSYNIYVPEKHSKKNKAVIVRLSVWNTMYYIQYRVKICLQ
jgi:hypothetical protein